MNESHTTIRLSNKIEKNQVLFLKFNHDVGKAPSGTPLKFFENCSELTKGSCDDPFPNSYRGCIRVHFKRGGG